MPTALEAYSKISQTSEMESFVKIINSSKLLIISQNAPYKLFDRILNAPLLFTFRIYLCSDWTCKFTATLNSYGNFKHSV